MEVKKGWAARVLAGNDRDRIYAVEADEGRYAVLSDESGKRLRKNKKHIQIIKKMCGDSAPYRR